MTRPSPARRDTSPPSQGVLLLGFFLAASVGAIWAVMLAMGRATKRAWPSRRGRASIDGA